MVQVQGTCIHFISSFASLKPTAGKLAWRRVIDIQPNQSLQQNMMGWLFLWGPEKKSEGEPLFQAP